MAQVDITAEVASLVAAADALQIKLSLPGVNVTLVQGGQLGNVCLAISNLANQAVVMDPTGTTYSPRSAPIY